MKQLNILTRRTKPYLFAIAILFLGACGGKTGGGGGGGGGTGSGITSGNVNQLGPGAGISHSENFTVYGSLTSQPQGTSKGGIYQVTGPTTTLGSESVGK